MSQVASIVKVQAPDDDALFAAIAEGDLSKLSKQQKLVYYTRRCSDLGLNPLNQPFQWLLLNGKLTLYANRACTEELRANRNISIAITSREMIGDCYVVTAKATLPGGRADESTGAVSLPESLKGEARANALLKAETKAKRRVTLSICGLGMLDETEVQSIPPSMKQLEVGAAAYEKQHAEILAKVAAAQPENENQQPAIAAENISQDPAVVLIDEATRRNLFSFAHHKNISHEDLKRYLSEVHNLASTSQITVAMLADIQAWMESVTA